MMTIWNSACILYLQLRSGNYYWEGTPSWAWSTRSDFWDSDLLEQDVFQNGFPSCRPASGVKVVKDMHQHCTHYFDGHFPVKPGSGSFPSLMKNSKLVPNLCIPLVQDETFHIQLQPSVGKGMMQGHHSSLKVLEKAFPFFEALKSPSKRIWCSKVSEYSIRGPWKCLNSKNGQ